MSPAPAAPVPTLNVANALTVLRLLLVPVLAALLLAEDGESAPLRWLATGVFVLAAWTDRLDGALARDRGLVTAFGSFADPVADKALTGTALVALALVGDLPWAVPVVVLVREVAITVLRVSLLSRRGVVAASRGGKWKTALQGLAIGLYLLPVDGLLEPVRAAVMALAVAVTVITGVQIVVRVLRAPAAESA